MSDMFALQNWAISNAALFFAVFLRVGAIIAFAPGIHDFKLPMRIKIVAALAFTLVVTPSQQGIETVQLSSFFVEILIGLFWGGLLRIIFLALEIAGAIASQSTSLAQMFNGADGQAHPIIARFLFLAGIAFACLSGLHITMAIYIIHSYSLLPLGQLPNPVDIFNVSISEVSRSFSLAFTLAAPFIIGSLLYQILIGVINRAMPQLMVSFIGAPAITMGSLVLLFLITPLILTAWWDVIQAFMFEGPE